MLATPAHRIVDLGIAHVPENRRLFPRLTVDDNLKMGAYMPGARAKYAQRLEFVFDLFPRMKERRSQMAGTMSGGEQQMCAIGRALMSDPKLLLLDEPSAGLAPVVVQQVFELVKRIRASGLTVLIVEQNVQQVLKVVDRAYLLEAGTIRASGTSEEMLSTDTIKQAYLGYRHDPESGHRFSERSCLRIAGRARCRHFSTSSTSICWKPWSTASCSAACWRCWRSGSI